VYALAYAAGVWSWTIAIVGIGLRFFAKPGATKRYIADASYWIYLVHLPLVMFLQALVHRLPWHWTVKFALVLSAALGVLFLSYHAFVRFTFVGEILNGRRQGRQPSGLPPVAPASNEGRADDAGVGMSPADAIATLKEARKSFGATLALDGLSLDVRRGELLAVLGPNGAGKSTAISLLLGLLRPDSGSVQVFGESPERVEARHQIGVMMQEVTLAPELRPRELIELTASYYPSPMTPDAAMALTQTASLAHRPYGKLSAGQKRQVQFALAVCGRPALLFLDEPTVGLDVQARETLWKTVRQLVADGCSIVLTTHYLEEAEALADRVIVLSKGRLIASGSVDDVRAIVARKRIRCFTSLTPGEISSWPAVTSATFESGRIDIVTTDAEAIVRRLLDADERLRELEVQRAGLAEAFNELTQEAA
jgi:ABC-type multidrug transport system ATPase subunit